jgi:hypothetical protein
VISYIFIQVSLGLRKPYNFVSVDGRFKGADLHLLDLLKKSLGFECRFRIESNYGMQRLPNGTYVGFLASVSVLPSSMDIDRTCISMGSALSAG